MARLKQAPVKREPSSEYFDKETASWTEEAAMAAKKTTARASSSSNEKPDVGALQLLIAVGGIYASFLTWGYLQEKLTTTAHGPPDAPATFRYPVFLNTIQSGFAAVTGFLYLWASKPRGSPLPPIVPSTALVPFLALVALTSSLASPFGYASLAHIDYITFLLAKSCKLLPVMALQVTLFGKRYPWYKYMVVASVTAGVAVFTLHSGKTRKSKAVEDDPTRNAMWGMLLLGINLLFDGLTNTTQDWIMQRFKPFSGPQMMCANAIMSTLVTGTYLVLSPWLVHTGIGEYLGMDLVGSAGELRAALDFMMRYPAVWKDVLGFAACGAVGQVFIFYTLSAFGSVLLVTVTVTRKMFTMIISVVAFGHKPTNMQWLGILLVFGGIGVEAKIARDEKMAKEAAKKAELEGKKK